MSLPDITVTDLEIDWSAQTSLPIEFQGRECPLIARAYQGKDNSAQALVLMNASANHEMPPIDKNIITTVRVHSGCVTGDIFHSLRCDCYQQLQAALETIINEPHGILVYLPYQEGRGIGLVNKIRAYALQDEGLDTVDANLEIGKPVDARDYAFTAAILKDIGISRIRLLTNNPAKSQALQKCGLEIVEQVPLRMKPSAHNKAYLDTKRSRMDHKI